MLPLQRKLRFRVVIKFDGFPLLGAMAVLAGVAQLSFMHIVNLMAGNTLIGRILEMLVSVAIFAINFLMFSSQLKLSFVVIEAGFFPRDFGVTFFTFLAKTVFVGVILLVAGVTVFRRETEFFFRFMTTRAGKTGMFTFEHELSFPMVEILVV